MCLQIIKNGLKHLDRSFKTVVKGFLKKKKKKKVEKTV